MEFEDKDSQHSIVSSDVVLTTNDNTLNSEENLTIDANIAPSSPSKIPTPLLESSSNSAPINNNCVDNPTLPDDIKSTRLYQTNTPPPKSLQETITKVNTENELGDVDDDDRQPEEEKQNCSSLEFATNDNSSRFNGNMTIDDNLNTSTNNLSMNTSNNSNSSSNSSSTSSSSSSSCSHNSSNGSSAIKNESIVSESEINNESLNETNKMNGSIDINNELNVDEPEHSNCDGESLDLRHSSNLASSELALSPPSTSQPASTTLLSSPSQLPTKSPPSISQPSSPAPLSPPSTSPPQPTSLPSPIPPASPSSSVSAPPSPPLISSPILSVSPSSSVSAPSPPPISSPIPPVSPSLSATTSPPPISPPLPSASPPPIPPLSPQNAMCHYGNDEINILKRKRSITPPSESRMSLVIDEENQDDEITEGAEVDDAHCSGDLTTNREIIDVENTCHSNSSRPSSPKQLKFSDPEEKQNGLMLENINSTGEINNASLTTSNNNITAATVATLNSNENITESTSNGIDVQIDSNLYGHTTEEMKFLLKRQVQYSDLGKLFGNFGFPTNNSDDNSTSTATTNTSNTNVGHFNNYAQYLGLQPTVKFKCFKCADPSFSSLVELKDHQIVCLRSSNENGKKSGGGGGGDGNCNIIKNNTHNDQMISGGSSLNSIINLNSSETTKTNNKLLDNHCTVATTATSSSLSTITTTSTTTTTPQPPPTTTTTNHTHTKFRITRKVYLCSTCGTYYENWNLFYHMREVHKKFICLLCLGIFPSAERLVHHLEQKHSTKPDIYEHKEQLLQRIKEQCYLMCSVCEHIFSEHDDFTNHSCENYIQACSLCGLKFIHKPNCKAGVKTQQQQQNHNHHHHHSHQQQQQQQPSQSHRNNVKQINKSNGRRNGGTKKLIDQSTKQQLAQTITKAQPTKPIIDHKTNGFGCQDDDSNVYVPPHPPHPPPPASTFDSDDMDISSPPPTSTIQTFGNNNYNPKTNEIYESSAALSLVQSIQPNEFIPITDIHTKMNQQYSSINNAADTTNYLMYKNQYSKIDDRCAAPKNIPTSIQRNSFLASCEDIIDDRDLAILKRLDEYTEAVAKQKEISTESTELIIADEESKKYGVVTVAAAAPTTIPQTEEKPLLVPKLKLKLSTHFPTPIESEESSTESSEEDAVADEDDDDDDEEEENDNEEGREEVEEYKDINKDENKLSSLSNDPIIDDSNIIQTINNENRTEILANIEQPVLDHRHNEPILNEEDDDADEDSDAGDDEEEEEKDINVEDHDDDILHENITNDAQQSTIQSPLPLEVSPTLPSSPPPPALSPSPPPNDGIELANEDTQIIELMLNEPLDRIQIREFLRICLRAAYPICLYCNHARKIAVDGNSLALHLLATHRFSATVDSITAEELQPTTITQRIKSHLIELNQQYFNLDSYDSCDPDFKIQYEKSYDCFQCRFHSAIHKDLYLHNRKMHLKSILFCLMCRSNFYSFSELICHICPGSNIKLIPFELRFRCVLCRFDNIPSAFRLMVHLRKKHLACDVCLEECTDQSKLSSHVWKHKLHHLCYRCGIAYRNKPDITKHLFWKHGTESVLCKRCLQKKWPHVYHFCIPPLTFTCEVCNLSFSKAVALKVHKRLHSDDQPYPCTEDNCEKKFISRKLLLKHVARHVLAANPPPQPPPLPLPSIIDENIMDVDIVAENDHQQTSKITTDKMETNTTEEETMLKDSKTNTVRTNKAIKSEHEISEITLKSENKVSTENKEVKTSDDKCEIIIDEKPKSLIDIISDLPAPNLSESDSSDESDNETRKLSAIKMTNSIVGHSDKIIDIGTANKLLDTNSSQLNESFNEDDEKPPPVTDIWENFKSYQASKSSSTVIPADELEDESKIIPPPVLHVVQSDHDYAVMVKVIIPEEVKSDDEQQPTPPVVKQESSKNKSKRSGNGGRSPKSGTNSSSSSDSDSSSCSCGTNCSCSTSSSGDGSSSSSSSSSDSDSSESSSSEGRRKQAERKATKKQKRDRLKSEQSAKANLSSDNNIDVVSTDTNNPNQTTLNLQKHQHQRQPPRPQPPISPVIVETDPDLLIFESDLETDESETDEEFYDEHPQRLASELLAEKRKQLMLQTCANPSLLNPCDIVENSRPSTPSLPEEIVKSKKGKTKKRKKERKTTTTNITTKVPTLKLNIPLKKVIEIEQHQQFTVINQATINPSMEQSVSLHPPPSLPPPPPPPLTPVASQLVPPITLNLEQTPQIVQQQAIKQKKSAAKRTTIPATIRFNQKARYSTGSSCSDIDTPLKRSKRRRIPNKFYGYTSDDDTTGGGGYTNPADAFKPTPPPNLTWRKEDLPATSSLATRTPPIKTIIKLPPSLNFNKQTTSRQPSPTFEYHPTPQIVSTCLTTAPTHVSTNVAVSGPSFVYGGGHQSLIPQQQQQHHHHQQKQKQQQLPVPQAPTFTSSNSSSSSSSESSISPQKTTSNSQYHQPPIPPIIIRPNRIQLPPMVEPLRVPAVPVHHIVPPVNLLAGPDDTEKSTDSSDSDSSDEGTLQISSQQQQTPQLSSHTTATIQHQKNNKNKLYMQSISHLPRQIPQQIATTTTQPQLLNQQPTQLQLPNTIPSMSQLLPATVTNQIRYPIMPPAGCRPAREGESVYCYCRCPYDEVSEMIACDGVDCPIEWFHFECVNIMVPPKGTWYCPQCRPKYEHQQNNVT